MGFTTTQNYSASVTLDANGEGTVRFAPVACDWVVNRITVKVQTAVLESMATVYRGLVGAPYEIGSSVSGSTGDTDTEIAEELRDGTALYIVWTGGDVGALATATIRVQETR